MNGWLLIYEIPSLDLNKISHSWDIPTITGFCLRIYEWCTNWQLFLINMGLFFIQRMFSPFHQWKPSDADGATIWAWFGCLFMRYINHDIIKLNKLYCVQFPFRERACMFSFRTRGRLYQSWEGFHTCRVLLVYTVHYIYHFHIKTTKNSIWQIKLPW